MSPVKRETWQEKAEAKRAEVLSNIPQAWVLGPKEIKELRADILGAPAKLLTPEELVITEIATATELSKKLANGELKCLDVAKAFMHRAAIATQLTNCGTEIFFERGMERAKYLDDYFKENKKPIGPFHGLPISIKDSFNVEGIDTTLGYTERIGNAVCLKQSSMVDMLHELGAVLYIKTNIPQTMMTADSENNIFGRTLNPNNPALTAGGLSGGEGAIVKQRGSILGVGTDIAGSIRIPSACCHTYGFKPSNYRLPYYTKDSVDDSFCFQIDVSSGPIANSFEDLKFFYDTMVEKKPWKYDVTCSLLPPIKAVPSEQLRIGIIYEDPLLPVHTPVKNLLRSAAVKLEEAGHKVVPLSVFPCFENAWKTALSIYTIKVEGEFDSLEPLFEAKEPLIASLSQAGIEHYVPTPPDTLRETVACLREAQSFSQKWHDIFLENELDVLITPPAPSTAPPHDTYGIAPYTAMWNLVDYPAIVVPYKKAEIVDDDKFPRLPPHLVGIFAHYVPEDYKDGLTSVQIVSPKGTDESLLAAAELIDKVLNEHK